MTTNEIANELLNVMFAQYEEESDLDMFNFESLVEMLGEPEGKINRALWLLSEDGYTKVWKIDNIAWESMLNSKTISYMEKCPLSTDGKRITKYIEPEDVYKRQAVCRIHISAAPLRVRSLQPFPFSCYSSYKASISAYASCSRFFFSSAV